MKCQSVFSESFAYVALILFLPCYEPSELIPERPEITYLNEDYVENVTLSAQRFKRNGAVVVNLYGTTKAAWGNNITVDVVFYEYMSNEYKPSFLELHKGVCTLTGKNHFLGRLLYNGGLNQVPCPYPAGRYVLANMTPESLELPSNFPITKGRINFTLTQNQKHELIATAAMYFTLSTTSKYKKKKNLY